MNRQAGRRQYNYTTFDTCYTDLRDTCSPTQGDLKNRACEQELNELVGLRTSPTFTGLRAPADTHNQALHNTINSGDAVMGSRAPMNSSRTEAGDAVMGSRAPMNSGRTRTDDASMGSGAPSGDEPRGLYCWGVRGVPILGGKISDTFVLGSIFRVFTCFSQISSTWGTVALHLATYVHTYDVHIYDMRYARDMRRRFLK